MSKEFSLNEKGHFIIENYQNKRTFASFLPGIAGKLGIPIWAFYVNRGQGIASFGSKDKDNPIMEFFPANKSYRNVPTKGFRTFIKLKKDLEEIVYEPFRKLSEGVSTKMTIAPHALTIEEENLKLGFKVKVNYFIVPNEDFGALVRRVKVKNISDKDQEVEVLDGMPILVPYGMENGALKEVSQTVSAWAKVYSFENKTPFYKLRASAEDEAEVKQMDAGNFYLSFVKEGENNKLLMPLVDPDVVFAEMTSLDEPLGFIREELADYKGEQILENRFPTAMSATKKMLEAGQEVQIDSVYGNLADQDRLAEVAEKVLAASFLDNKEEETKKVHNYYADYIFTVSGEPTLDAYSRQTFMDNLLRGGFPISLGSQGNEQTYHIFSRKHGDLERDYNEFLLEPTYYSQGNGNFRDVNQNRRCDNYFNPKVKEDNIKVFANLIQADGYNPLVIEGSKFYIPTTEARDVVLDEVSEEAKEKLAKRLEKPFTPGEIAVFIDNFNIDINLEMKDFIDLVIDNADSWTVAKHGEGYWIDHWTYTLDLVENYLAVYPENLKDLLFDESYTFYDNFTKVLPRSKKYVLTDNGPRQYESVHEDEEKEQLIANREYLPYAVRTNKGTGEVYYTNLIVKFLALAVNKVSALDPYGMGIEMEANKPGWYDALNGLPGLFGSAIAESIEIKRIIDFLNDSLADVDDTIKLPQELYSFYQGIVDALNAWIEDKDNFKYWELATSLREGYREEVFMGFAGAEEEISVKTLKDFFNKALAKLNYGIEAAKEEDTGLFTMYFSYDAVEYEKTGETSSKGLAHVKVTKFEQHRLPAFLEGQVRAMKVLEDKEEARKLHESVHNSDLYDQPLGMYRVNGDLNDESYEIGRARAFSPGWLENGSIWMHMEYKYLLELLKAGLYDEYYQAIDTALVPFQDPKVYGRSILENSSFILSTLNSDKKNHGRGYIARLSGATAEYIHMWSLMCFGSNPFTVNDGELIYKPEPVLSSNLFTTEAKTIELQISEVESKEIAIPQNSFAHRFLGETLVVYHNPSRANTFGDNRVDIESYKLLTKNGEEIVVEDSEVKADLAEKVRQGEISRIDIFLA
ncbi:hypothetical protein [Orenia marismortui]|uniref:hypothetical protein n=1 Tax=Orenia marismortui TaxID=46469 RepID=UPI0003803138|nr:hypothetical protein [Orenia marismortui]